MARAALRGSVIVDSLAQPWRNARHARRVGDTGHVTTTTMRLGRDGKSYPASPLTREERNRARWMAHNLVHGDGLSIRAAQARMAEAGLRRSRGAIGADLAGYECPRCANRTPGHLDA
jgi:hypothetical protein